MIKKILLSPITVVISMILGMVFGIYFKNISEMIKPVGDIYLSMLQMCVIPIMASAVMISISKLFKNKDVEKYVSRIIGSFIVFLFAVCIISFIGSMIARPFLKMDSKAQKTIGREMFKDNNSSNSVIKEVNSTDVKKEEDNDSGIMEFIKKLIPENIFDSLTKGENLKIIFFFIILGIMLKYVSENSYNNIISLFEGVYEAFQSIIMASMYFLPFGLFALVSNQFSKIGMDMFLSLVKLIAFIYIMGTIIFLISVVVLSKKAKVSILFQIKALKDVILICLGARNSIAAIPSAISGLSEKLKLNKEIVNLSLPLGVTLCRYGSLMVYSITVVFASQLYDYKFTIYSIVLVIFSLVTTAIAASGTQGVIEYTMIGIVLSPLGIPSAAITIILIAIDPIIDPIMTLLNVYPTCTAVSTISTNEDSDEDRDKNAVLA